VFCVFKNSLFQTSASDFFCVSIFALAAVSQRLSLPQLWLAATFEPLWCSAASSLPCENAEKLDFSLALFHYTLLHASHSASVGNAVWSQELQTATVSLAT
jgi:hypothetical protein